MSQEDLINNKKWLAILIGGAVVIVAAATVVGVFVFFRQVSRPGEATAKYMPSNTPIYFSVNLRPGIGQIRTGRKVISLLQTEDFLDWRDDLLKDLETQTGIHFLDDVTPWIGTDVSFALLDLDTDVPEWVLLAQISDRDAALDFVEDLVDYLEDEFYPDFDGDEYKGADIWVSEEGSTALGVTSEYLIITDGEDTMKGIIRNIESPLSRSLADKGAFIAARESVPAKRVAFLFVDTKKIVGVFEEFFDPYGDQDAALREIRRNIPEYVASSTSFIENGIRLDLVADTPPEALTFDTETPLRSPDVLPADTLALVSGVGVREIWEQYVETLDSYVGDEFDRILRDFHDETGVDIEDDLIDRLTDEVALAFLSSDFTFEGLDAGDVGSVDALLLAGVDDGQSVQEAFDSITAFVEKQGIEIDRNRLGDYEAVTVKLDDTLFDGFDPEYMVSDDWALVGSTLESLEAFHDVATGATDSLSSATEFDRLIGLVPHPFDFLFYADIAGILAEVENALDAGTRSDYRRSVKPFIEPLDAVLTVSSITEEEMRLTAVLTLREQPGP